MKAPERSARTWIQSARFDLSFFVLSPLVALPVLIISPQPSLLSLTFACVLGIPHYLSTFVFFFWDETRTYHRAHWLLFFGGPVLIVAALAGAVAFRVPFVVQVVVYVWNIYHVARQSCGILSIYRVRAGVRDASIKPVVNSAIVSSAFALAFWNTPGYPTLHTALTLVWAGLPRAIWLGTSAVAVLALVRLALSLRRRFDGPHPPGLPELAFLGTSLLLFHPYLWIDDANQATLGMLLGHFIQYLGIVWLVHWRRFAGAEARPRRTWLGALSTNIPVLVVLLLASGGVSLALRVLPAMPVQAAYSGMLLALALVHFYLDGLFWAFRRPEVRESLAPYLMVTPSPPLPAADGSVPSR